jgi:hypothetical protein
MSSLLELDHGLQNKVRESETIEQGELARQARNFTARQMLAHQRSHWIKPVGELLAP